ncbi:MAG: Acg family FMN-binding oxidoreductase [Bdellovibrionota bacterium]
MNKDELNKLIDMVRWAAMAPSNHNSQPWKFALYDNEVHILPDFSRKAPVSDPQGRELFISLGCALENLAIAMCHAGYRPEVELFTGDDDSLRVKLGAGNACADPSLFPEIPKRQTCRSLFQAQTVSEMKWDELRQVVLEPGVSAQFIKDADTISNVTDLVVEADTAQLSDEKFRAEVLTWIRPNSTEAKRRGDGIAAAALGVPSGPRWLGTFLAKHSLLSSVKPEMDRDFLFSSSGLIVFTSRDDDKKTWVNLGRSLERLLLRATALKLQTAFLNQPIEIPFMREELRARLRLKGMWPQIMVRLGYSKPAPKSMRRPVEDLIIDTPDSIFARAA